MGNTINNHRPPILYQRLNITDPQTLSAAAAAAAAATQVQPLSTDASSAASPGRVVGGGGDYDDVEGRRGLSSLSKTDVSSSLCDSDSGTTPERRRRRRLRRRDSMSATLLSELWGSSEIVFGSRLTWLLVFGPIAIAGGSAGFFGEFVCFIFAGLALIPCAERLSFVTEQVAAHTNSTIGALLNATFGNAPEFLISSAALRAGFYRVVQLTLLGSILCNLLLVFGISCFIGGLRWQVQEVILTSGNVSIGLLLVGAAGMLLPAVLKLCNQEMFTRTDEVDAGLQFSRFNAAIMLIMYVCYLFFQLATHKDEFDEGDGDVTTVGGGGSADAAHPSLPVMMMTTRRMKNEKTRRNLWCKCCFWNEAAGCGDVEIEMTSLEPVREAVGTGPGRMIVLGVSGANDDRMDDHSSISMDDNDNDGGDEVMDNQPNLVYDQPQSLPVCHTVNRNSTNKDIKKRSTLQSRDIESFMDQNNAMPNTNSSHVETTQFIKPNYVKAHSSDHELDSKSNSLEDASVEELIPLRAGIVWLLAITLCISAISDVIVDTIDGFAEKCQLSEIFTSVIIVPFFSNIAEQVSAVLFAYRNKMDLCLGVTVGSAIQISTCVLPGCVLCGWFIDRSISLFFEGYETCCLVLGVLSVSAILHGGTTNWLAGAFFIGMYLMFAAGFWFHEEEDLSIDEELILHNITMGDAPS